MLWRVFGVCGASASGKTTLLKALVAEFSSRGMAVGVVKHHGHPDALELPEGMRAKDSHQLFAAGARCAAVSFRGGVWMEARDEDLPEIVARYMGWADVVLLEGFKGAPVKKIEVVAPGKEPIVAPGKGVVALAVRGGGGQREGIRVLDASRVKDVADFIIRELEKQSLPRVIVNGRPLEGLQGLWIARVLAATLGESPERIEVASG